MLRVSSKKTLQEHPCSIFIQCPIPTIAQDCRSKSLNLFLRCHNTISRVLDYAFKDLQPKRKESTSVLKQLLALLGRHYNGEEALRIVVEGGIQCRDVALDVFERAKSVATMLNHSLEKLTALLELLQLFERFRIKPSSNMFRKGY